MKTRVRQHVRRRPSLFERAEEVKAGKREGFTYTKLFRFDLNDHDSMERVYDILGDHIMYVIATTNRPLSEMREPPATPRTAHGVGLWRGEFRTAAGRIFADDVDLFFDIPERDALRIAKFHKQDAIVKVHGGHRHANVLPVVSSGRTQRRLPVWYGGAPDVPSSVYVRGRDLREATE